jgi:hypothetical protein
MSIYLATTETLGRRNYQLRCSVEIEPGRYQPASIFDLGSEPQQHFELYEEHIVIFSAPLLAAVAPHSRNVETTLEKILWQFLPAETKRRVQSFQARDYHRPAPLSDGERRRIDRELHIFDRRRLYYLYYGAVDQSRLSRLHIKCCRPLLGQCRDEREYYFQEMEKVIEPGKYLQYVYAIFNLQKHFYASFAPWFPEALARDEMADHFVDAICRLNANQAFWQKQNTSSSLHPHLRRYLVMFFDFPPTPRSFWADFARSFMADHRHFRWPERKSQQSPEEILELFGISFDELKKMDRIQITKLYRQKALQLHPDQGGDHEKFIALTEIYQEMTRDKRASK